MAVILVFLVVLLVVAVAARALNRRATPRPPVAPPRLDAPPPTFNVVALGVAGSGKTVFLASMFHRLNVQQAGAPYFLEADAAQRVALSAVFNRLRNPDEPWPRGTRTGETREFTFDCASFHDGVKYRVLRINYLDYAGELLEQEQEAGSTALADLERRISNAHALLGMIDGYRMLQYLRGEPRGHEYVEASLQPMIGIMAAATCPIHLVLTKWDLVRGFGEPEDADDNTRLGLVRDALLENAQIRALAAGHGRGPRIVRLIPVSAVGRKFATIAASGEVVKRLDGELNPSNVETPLSAVLPDLFRQVQASLDASVQAEIAALMRSRMRLGPAGSVAALAKVLSIPAGIVLETTLGRSYGQEVVGVFLDWIGRPFDEHASGVKRARDKAERQALTLQHVRAAVLNDFTTTVWRLEATLPASVLSNG
jgi:hypothetical protein